MTDFVGIEFNFKVAGSPTTVLQFRDGRVTGDDFVGVQITHETFEQEITEQLRRFIRLVERENPTLVPLQIAETTIRNETDLVAGVWVMQSKIGAFESDHTFNVSTRIVTISRENLDVEWASFLLWVEWVALFSLSSHLISGILALRL